MNAQKQLSKLAPQTRRAQGGVGAPHLHEAETDPKGGTTRSGTGGPGTSPSTRHERKDAGWTSRQGGGQETDR